MNQLGIELLKSFATIFTIPAILSFINDRWFTDFYCVPDSGRDLATKVSIRRAYKKTSGFITVIIIQNFIKTSL